MKIPLSWLKDFINLDGLSIEDIARKLTLAGMEVDESLYAGLPMPIYNDGEKHEFKTNGIAWDKEKIVVAEIREVKAHPNADKLTLLDLFDGKEDQVVLTGAPNIFHLKGTGKLEKPIKVAYAKEGSVLYDGHADGHDDPGDTRQRQHEEVVEHHDHAPDDGAGHDEAGQDDERQFPVVEEHEDQD